MRHASVRSVLALIVLSFAITGCEAGSAQTQTQAGEEAETEASLEAPLEEPETGSCEEGGGGCYEACEESYQNCRRPCWSWFCISDCMEQSRRCRARCTPCG